MSLCGVRTALRDGWCANTLPRITKCAFTSSKPQLLHSGARGPRTLAVSHGLLCTLHKWPRHVTCCKDAYTRLGEPACSLGCPLARTTHLEGACTGCERRTPSWLGDQRWAESLELSHQVTPTRACQASVRHTSRSAPAVCTPTKLSRRAGPTCSRGVHTRRARSSGRWRAATRASSRRCGRTLASTPTMQPAFPSCSRTCRTRPRSTAWPRPPTRSSTWSGRTHCTAGPSSRRAAFRPSGTCGDNAPPRGRLHRRARLQACINSSTNYCDLTGEANFVADTISAYHLRAQGNECKIVHACGFDSVPSDIGTLMLVDHFKKKHGVAPDVVEMMVGGARSSRFCRALESQTTRRWVLLSML